MLRAEIYVVEGARHIYDLFVEVGSKRWEKGMASGYSFLLSALGRSGE